MLAVGAGGVSGLNSRWNESRGSAIALILLVVLESVGLTQAPASWSVVTLSAWTSWLALWLYRTLRADPTSKGDLWTVLLIELWNFAWKRPHLSSFCTATWCSDPITWQVLALLGICAASAGIGVAYEQHQSKSDPNIIPEIEPFDDEFLKPMLLPCRTTHTRLFPKKHSFSYSYLLVGIPVGWRGLIGNALSVDTQILPPEHRRSGWFHISGADYLDRDGTDLDLKAKLASYLQSQGENPGDFPHVYLVTAPKFLGYSFNPVSFWYLYSELRHLKAMILEVNNTFDERRMYFLKPTDGPDSTIKHGSNDATELLAMDHESLPNLGNANSQPAVFSNAWSKDFHVSPFNDRTGSYSLIAYDPLSRHEHSKWLVDNTVVLKSAENHPKLVARIFADGDPVDPQARGRLDIYPFLIRWWWVGFVTFPRILKEAWILYFKRSLPVWFRPEIDKNSIGRTPTGTERLLATYFERYLEHLVKHANQPLCLVYQPPSGMGLRRSFKTTERHTDTHLSNIELHVLTPAFYSRFVHYSHTSEAFDRECLCTDELNRTLWISRPELLPALFKKGKQAGSDLVHHLPKNENVLERLRWAMLKRLRCSPTGPGYPDRQEHTHSVSKQDIRSRPYSELDWHVRKHQEDSSRYRHKTTALFLAQRFAFGFEGVISALDLLLRFALILCPWLYKSIILNPTIWLFPNWHTQRYLEAAALELLLTNLVHIWALLK